MKTHRVNRNPLLAAVCLGLVALLAGCSTDSPSEPTQQPAPPGGGGGGGGNNFSISVAADPATLPAGTEEPATITVQVRRSDNGQAPANGTTIVVTTSLGELGSLGSGVTSRVLSLVNGNAQILLFPGQVPGTAVVQARLEGSVGQANVRVETAATFFVSFVRPNQGTPNGGDVVTIEGGGFTEPVRVTFDGVAAQILEINPNRIRVVTPPSTVAVPSGTTRPVNVGVTVNLNEDDEDSDTLQSGFIYSPGGSVSQPTVLSVSPASGVNEGGTRVTITGLGFAPPVQVLFGQGNTAATFSGVEATIESASQSQIVVRTPSATGFGQDNQNQLVNILVRNLQNGFTTVSQSAFRYGATIRITSVSPGQVVFDSQDTVTIFGQGFESPVTVNVAGIQATVLNVSGSEIRVRAPIPVISNCAGVSGPIQVINVNSGASDTTSSPPDPVIADFLFSIPSPIVTSVSPSSGSGNGGTSVTISGTGFDAPVRVVFGDAAGSGGAVNGSGTSISGVLTPSFSDFASEPCDDSPGDGQQGTRLRRETVDVTVTNLLTGCDDTLTGGFTFIPPNESCVGDDAPVVAQCNDGFDNDSDGFIDALDPQCTGPTDPSESV